MLPVGHVSKRRAIRSAYVCLSCRLQSTAPSQDDLKIPIQKYAEPKRLRGREMRRIVRVLKERKAVKEQRLEEFLQSRRKDVPPLANSSKLEGEGGTETVANHATPRRDLLYKASGQIRTAGGVGIRKRWAPQNLIRKELKYDVPIQKQRGTPDFLRKELESEAFDDPFSTDADVVNPLPDYQPGSQRIQNAGNVPIQKQWGTPDSIRKELESEAFNDAFTPLVRRQRGTPYGEKLKELENDAFDGLLGAHADLSVRRSIDLEEFAGAAKLPTSLLYTPLGQQESETVGSEHVKLDPPDLEVELHAIQGAHQSSVQNPDLPPQVHDQARQDITSEQHQASDRPPGTGVGSVSSDMEYAGAMFVPFGKEDSMEHGGAAASSTDRSDIKLTDRQPSVTELVNSLYRKSDTRQRNSISRTNRSLTLPTTSPSGVQARLFHTSRRNPQQAAATIESEPNLSPPLASNTNFQKNSPIRHQLRQWQELHGHKEDPSDQLVFDQDPDSGGAVNNLTRLPEVGSSFRNQDLEEEEEREAFQGLMRSAAEDHDRSMIDDRFLNIGDLVELEFPRSERESIIAVFVRRLGYESQFYTMTGRWIHMPERHIQYSIPGWVSPQLVEPLLPYLPDPQDLKEAEQLSDQAYVQDLSVPRHISAGLVKRMTQFHTESQEIYRKHAGALDSAHDRLAHKTDLRYGSLVTAATTLLQMEASELPVTALFTVRKALARAGFAFNIDRRSHRLTGYLQIRSKDQVKMVEQVREWLREWQDDMAVRTALRSEKGERALRLHRTSKNAQYVYDFIEKAKKIVLQSRENRDATPYGNVGPSKKKFPITPSSDCVKVNTDTQFTWEDSELVRFMEAWACSSMFLGLPRIEALPPLILQATGLYADMGKYTPTGCLFLQELGTIMPYENRVRFDQNLLLPSSQHSKPLQLLMESLMKMREKHNFSDSMSDLRHDWKDMPVYCVDKPDAHEIDDGISIERAGSNEWWVHVHIANPTAFFERNHSLAKMARHMGESIYMPERTYMMLPRWATSGHFSLTKNRPCLTFSAKLDAEGRTLEKKIQPGIVRNVLHLTPDDIRSVWGSKKDETPELVVRVGGELPPPRARKNTPDPFTEDQVEALKMLQRLAQKRSGIRRAAGGLFMNMESNDITVWQNWRGPGLNWDLPHRTGARTVEGDPIIQMRTQGLRNWFTPNEETVDVLVREMMLLACEVAGSWCAERQIPAIFRGSLRRPDTPDPETFMKEVLEPAMQGRRSGEYPMHLGVQYLASRGTVATSTKPITHSVLGMHYYGKVTSPLRRYGDMILHWQIQAALREEARLGKSLVTDDTKADRSFLPFSASVLESIMLGLGPREKLVTRAISYAEDFWTIMLLFRAFHYNEAELPFHTPAFPTKPDGTIKPLPRAYIYTSQYTSSWAVSAMLVDLNLRATLLRPDHHGLEEVRTGDLWECELSHVDVYGRSAILKPVRLVERAQYGAKAMRGMIGRAS